MIFGPYDFSFSIGHPGKTDHERVQQTWDIVRTACDRAGVPLMGFATPDNIREIVDD